MAGSALVRSVAASSWVARATTSGSLRPLALPGGLNALMNEANSRRPLGVSNQAPSRSATGPQSEAVPPMRPAGWGSMSTTMIPPDQRGMARADHQRQRAAHRMADDRRPVEPALDDIARDCLGERRRTHRAGAVAGGRRAGEARDLDQMIAIAGHRCDRRRPDLAAGGEAGNQDHVGTGAAHLDGEPRRRGPQAPAARQATRLSAGRRRRRNCLRFIGARLECKV